MGRITAAGEKSAEKALAGEKLIAYTTNTMTDRAAKNVKANVKLNNHFCGLHLLVNLAEQSSATLCVSQVVLVMAHL